ncbi:MAG: 3-oxoacyl-[acyl-carrier-protein] reductase FabG [Alphaproteobacteria bacterium MarineAlpha2_Bin1]|nr:MAG: 3-oxoacyl-[acyl-carrier-protein] reductase FabG [Alphaproteobacteria bacterium MarineAlpha2_Bin1]
MEKIAANIKADFTRLGPSSGSSMIVVGGCGGMGRSIVKAASASGIKVTVFDLQTSFEKHPVDNGVDFRPIDATDERSVKQAFAENAENKSIDSLINLVGFKNDLINVNELSSSGWDEVIEGNLKSAFLICNSAIPLMSDQGSIVNVASGLAARVLPGYSPYSASKAGLIALTKGIAIENAPRIRANAVAPAAVKTAFLAGGTGRVDNEDGDWDLDYQKYIQNIPLGRLGEVDDVVGPILFLCGSSARYMTGQVLWVNGGGLMP